MLVKSILNTLLITITCITSVFASDFSIPDIRLDVNISEDGMVQIDEYQTFRFDGSFSWVEYRLPKEGFTEIRNIRVSGNGKSYINENTEEPGTFQVSESDNHVIITVHFEAEDEARRFMFSYQLTDAVSVGSEWTDFFWTYLSPDRDRPTETFHADILLPHAVPVDSLYSWSRGVEPEVQFHPGQISITATDIPTGETLISRVLFPTSVFDRNLVSVSDPDLSLEQIRQDEEAYIQRQREREEHAEFYASITPGVTLVISAVSFGLFILLYLKFGKRYTTKTISTRETVVIPDRIQPALIGRLMMGRYTTVQHFTATLFDLARRGWYTIHEKEKVTDEQSWFTSDKPGYRLKRSDERPDEEPEQWETELIRFVDKRIMSGMDTFSKLFESDSNDVNKWYISWKKHLKEAFDQKNWVDTQSYTGAWLNVTFQLFLVSTSVYILAMGTILALVALIVSGLMLAASAFIIRRTPEGEKTYRRWNAYHKGLKNADKRTIRMEMLDRHFIFATAFHLSEKQITTILESSTEDTTGIFPWIYLMPGSMHSSASMASSISTLAASGTSTFSGTTGGTGATTASPGGGATSSAG